MFIYVWLNDMYRVFIFFFVKDIDIKEESVKLDGVGGNSF